MTARTVLHGVDQSCPTFASLPSNAPMGMRVYQEDMKNVWIFDGGLGGWTPDGVVSFKYDFIEHGGGQGLIEIGRLPGAAVAIEIDGADLTDGAIVVHLHTMRGPGAETIIHGGMYAVEAPLASDGEARIGLRAGDVPLLDLTGIAAVGAAGMHDLIPQFTAATAVRVGTAATGSSSDYASMSPSPSLPY